MEKGVLGGERGGAATKGQLPMKQGQKRKANTGGLFWDKKEDLEFMQRRVESKSGLLRRGGIANKKKKKG